MTTCSHIRTIIKKFSTLWRIAEGLNIKPHVLVKKIEEELGDNFSFIENF